MILDFIVDKSKGWNEVFLDISSFVSLYEVLDIMQTNLGIVFTNKLNDLDTIYCDFVYKDSKLCLCYNIYDGINIMPEQLKEASLYDSEMVIEISNLLLKKIKDINFKK